MNANRFVRSCAAVLGLAAIAGCAGDRPKWQRPKPFPAGGVVRLNGQPLEGALVTFTNATLGVSATGRTDAEGKFILTTFEQGDGAVPGKYKVAVSKVIAPAGLVDKHAAPVMRNARAPAAPQPRWLIPKRYGNAETSGLTAEVAEGGSGEIVLELHGSS
jgi:hypothetical protein